MSGDPRSVDQRQAADVMHRPAAEDRIVESDPRRMTGGRWKRVVAEGDVVAEWFGNALRR